MRKNQIVKHFTYCDVQGINSIYSQLCSNTEEISITKKKDRKLSGSVEIPYILQGFFPTNATGEYSRDFYNEQTSKVTITIEDKVRSILQTIGSDESKPIDVWSDKACLVAGYATIIEYDTILSSVKKLFEEHRLKYSDFESFLGDVRYSPEFESIWSEFTDFAFENGLFKRHGKVMKIDMSWGKKGEVMKCMAVDLRYPVIIHYSTDKLLLSNSEMENDGMIEKLPETGILGILKKASTNLYMLKPLAMWHDLSYEQHSTFIDRASKFIDHKEGKF